MNVGLLSYILSLENSNNPIDSIVNYSERNIANKYLVDEILYDDKNQITEIKSYYSGSKLKIAKKISVFYKNDKIVSIIDFDTKKSMYLEYTYEYLNEFVTKMNVYEIDTLTNKKSLTIEKEFVYDVLLKKSITAYYSNENAVQKILREYSYNSTNELSNILKKTTLLNGDTKSGYNEISYTEQMVITTVSSGKYITSQIKEIFPEDFEFSYNDGKLSVSYSYTKNQEYLIYSVKYDKNKNVLSVIKNNFDDEFTDELFVDNYYITVDTKSKLFISNEYDSTGALISKFRYEYNVHGDIQTVYEMDILNKTYHYQIASKAIGISIKDRRIIKVAFNYEIDSSQDFSSIIELHIISSFNDNELKILSVECSADNLNNLIITLNREIEIEDEFKIISTENIQFLKGDNTPLYIEVMDRVTLQETASENNILILQSEQNIFIQSSDRIKYIKMFDINGNLVFSDKINSQFYNISNTILNIGIYVIHIYDDFEKVTVKKILNYY